jgi:hypothetical protein
MNFRDGFFPEQGDQIKVWFEALKDRVNPDVIPPTDKTMHIGTIARLVASFGILSETIIR